jgi:nucleoside phosphorylase
MRGEGTHRRFVLLLRCLLASLYDGRPQTLKNQSQPVLRNYALDVLKNEAFPEGGRHPHVPAGLRSGESRVERATFLLEEAVNRLASVGGFRAIVEANRSTYLKDRVDVLLVTATETETRLVLDALISRGVRPGRKFLGNATYWDVGVVSAAHVYLVQVEMGSSSPGSSAIVLESALVTLSPANLIMVGACFGMNPEKASMGDVVVSKQLLNYEPQRVTAVDGRDAVTLRGDRVTASERLLGRCRAAVQDWDGPKVHTGLVLSGEKLVDSPTFREQLISVSGGEAVAGEMEGAGLYASANARKIDWIIIKGISDWADGRKAASDGEVQESAVAAAANFCVHVLVAGGLREPVE